MKISLPSAFVVLLTMIGGGVVVSTSPAESTAILLRTNGQVDGEGIFLNDVAASSSSSLPHTRIADAPAPGQTTTLTHAQIDEALRKAGVTLTVTNRSGADSVSMTRRVRSLGESELGEMLTAALQREHVKDKGQLELRFSRAWSPVTVPDDTITVKVLDLPTLGVTPNFIVRFELATTHETIGSWQMPVQTHVWREVTVARSPLKRGQLLSQADVIKERRDVLALRDSLLDDSVDTTMVELAQSVPAGAPLTERSVKQRTLVRRGQAAEALVQEGGMSVSLKVEVLEDGSLGQTVRIRNPQSRREFRGKVQNERTILVNL